MPHLFARSLPALLALVLVAGACSFDELLDFVEGAGGTDLSQSPDPAVQAAGQAASEVDKEREARNKLDQALETKDVTKVEEAQNLRPDDPRYPMYRAVLLLAAGQDWQAAVLEAVALMVAAEPDQTEGQRRMAELVLDALHDVAIAFPAGTAERGRLVAQYCAGLDQYPGRFTGPEADLYMVISADRSLC